MSENEDGLVDEGIRIKVKLLDDKENWYFFMSDTAVVPTVPYENRPDQVKVREAVEKTCKFITEQRELQAYLREQEDKPDHE